MRIREIEYQLRTYIPLHTDKFVSWSSVVSYSVSTNIATIQTTLSHGLSVGDIVHLRDVIFPNPITSLTQSQGVGTAILQHDTDFTFPNSETITISGANEADYNGTFNIISIPDRQTINFDIPFTAPVTATGSPVSEEVNLLRYNGLFQVVSIPTATTFTIAVDGPNFIALSGVEFYNIADVRIVGEISEERMLNSYTNQDIDVWWMFIVASTSNVSKNKDIATDFDFSYSQGDYIRQQVQESFTLYVVVPSQDTITTVDDQDICRNELKLSIINSIVGFFPLKLYRNSYEGVYYESDSISTYNTSYYIHAYNFSTTVNLASPDTFVPNSIAIKTIEFNHIDTIKDVKSTDLINLED